MTFKWNKARYKCFPTVDGNINNRFGRLAGIIYVISSISQHDCVSAAFVLWARDFFFFPFTFVPKLVTTRRRWLGGASFHARVVIKKPTDQFVSENNDYRQFSKCLSTLNVEISVQLIYIFNTRYSSITSIHNRRRTYNFCLRGIMKKYSNLCRYQKVFL